MRLFFETQSLRWLYLAAAMVSAAAAALGAWLTPFLMREHGLSVGPASAALALGSGLCGAIGAITGGRLADHLARRHPQGRYRLAITMLLLSLPVSWSATQTTNTTTAVTLACFTFLLLFTAIPICLGILLMLTPPDVRGLSGAVMQVITNLLGYGLGPMATGLLSDHLGEGGLGQALGLTLCTTAALGVLAFAAAARSAPRSTA